ncbi:MAG: hypothetical protein IJN21_06525 [Clostridia bacterium]|nr:hypothetical protein [Clostridiales bacterium]MBQ6716158.1 hypothetical protein [Clostridia bacterium]
MKRLFALILALCAVFSAGAVSELEAPVYEKAMPLYEILLSCDTFYNFDKIPDESMAREAVYRLQERFATLSEPILNEDAYKMLFSEGEYIYAQEEDAYLDPLPLKIEIESAVETGTGTIIVSLRVEKDFGFGMELWGYADIHILPDESAPFSAYVTRVFIPE